MIMILGPPAGDAFNFVVDLATYPATVFNLFMAIGLYLVRRQRSKVGLGRSDFRAWDVALIFTIIVSTFMLIMPWYPPLGGRNGGDVSFWYATYVVTGVAILLFCVVYYVVWIYVLPKAGKYTVRQEILVLDNGATSHVLVKVPNSQVSEWDASHDPTGKSIVSSLTLQNIDKVDYAEKENS